MDKKTLTDIDKIEILENFIETNSVKPNPSPLGVVGM